MTAPLIAVLLLVMVATSFLSGIFGMAGGMILIGVLLALLPLPAAMVLHAVTQMASNGWRAILWWRYIRWRPASAYVVGCAIVLIYSMLFGTYLYDAIDGTYSFVGAFSSKNQLGLYASLGVFFSYATVMIFRARGLWLIGSGLIGLLSAYSLLASQSATSVITTLGVVALCVGMQAMMSLTPQSRRIFFAAAVILVVVAGVGALQFGVVDRNVHRVDAVERERPVVRDRTG